MNRALGGGPVGILSGAPLAPHAEAVLALLRQGADCGRGYLRMNQHTHSVESTTGAGKLPSEFQQPG